MPLKSLPAVSPEIANVEEGSRCATKEVRDRVDVDRRRSRRNRAALPEFFWQPKRRTPLRIETTEIFGSQSEFSLQESVISKWRLITRLLGLPQP